MLTRLYSGLDARYMLSRLKPPTVDVLSLTTIATPHRGMTIEAGQTVVTDDLLGSSFADYVFHEIGCKFDSR